MEEKGLEVEMLNACLGWCKSAMMRFGLHEGGLGIVGEGEERLKTK